MPAVVRLGNVYSIDKDHLGERLEGHRVTTIHVLDEDVTAVRVRTISHPDGLWATHSPIPPAWVVSDDDELAAALAAVFKCSVGEPAGWSAEGDN